MKGSEIAVVKGKRIGYLENGSEGEGSQVRYAEPCNGGNRGMLGLGQLGICLLMLLASQSASADLLVFASGRGIGADIVLLDPASGTRVQLTETPQVMKWAPTWSPEATLLAWFEDAETGVSITVARPDGQVERCLAGIPAPNRPSPEVYTGSKLSWSPDGGRLAYPTNTGDLAMVDVVSGVRTVFDLDNYHAMWSGVSWLADGSGLVAFSGDGNFVVHADGRVGDERRITVDGGVPGYDPTISHDGRLLAFLSMPYALACVDGPCVTPAKDFDPQLYVMGMRDTVAIRLTESATVKCRPTWSPDGSWLAYAERQGDGDWDLVALPVQGGGVKHLTRGPTLDFDPNWGQELPTAAAAVSWAQLKKAFR